MHSFEAAASLEKPLQQYLQRLQRKSLSQSSLVNYRSDLSLFVQFIADYRVKTWQGLSAKQAQAFFRDGLHKEKSNASYKRQLSSVRGFLRFLQQQKLISFDPLVGLELAIQKKSMPSAPTKAQCQRLVSFEADSFLSLRDKAMIQLLINTPIQLSELVALDVFCLDYQQQSLVLKSIALKSTTLKSAVRKGLAQEAVHHQLTDLCFSDVNAWLEHRQNIVAFDQHLFISEQGSALTTRAVQLRVKYWREKMGLASYTLLQLKSAVRETEQPVANDRQALLTIFMKAHPRAKQHD